MENLTIRKATFSDLPIVSELIYEMVDSLARKDNVDVNIAVKNYHNFVTKKQKIINNLSFYYFYISNGSTDLDKYFPAGSADLNSVKQRVEV
jgi:hypothetical protein